MSSGMESTNKLSHDVKQLGTALSSDSKSSAELFPRSSETDVDLKNADSNMIAEPATDFCAILRSNYELVSRCLVVSAGLLFELKSVDYMRDKIPQIRQRPTNSLKVGELLNVLGEIPGSQQQNVHSAFLSTLRLDGQEHVANIFHPQSDARPMSDKHYKILVGKTDELRQFIDPTYAFINRLVHDAVLSKCDQESVMSKSDYSEMSSELVNILQRKFDRAFGRFVSALYYTKQLHIVYMVTDRDNERPLTRLRRQVLAKARKDLISRQVELKCSALVVELLSNGVLNEVDMLHIEAEQTNKNRTSVLMDVVARKHQYAYDKFIQAFKHKVINQSLLEGLELEGMLETNFKHDERNTDRSEVVQRIRENIKDVMHDNGYTAQELIRLMEQNGFAVSEVGLTGGSIHISFWCFTDDSLLALKRLYNDKTLDALFTREFCFKFAEQGLESLELHIGEDEFQKLTETFRQLEADNELDDAMPVLSEHSLTADQRRSEQQTSPVFANLPAELLELVLMRTFVSLFTDYYKSRCTTYEAIRLAYSTLAAVCYNWWQTMNGWPQSPTPHWFKHKLRHPLN